jgi:hypothetical protein
MDSKRHEKCSAGCETQQNEFPEMLAFVSIALEEQSTLNCDS